MVQNPTIINFLNHHSLETLNLGTKQFSGHLHIFPDQTLPRIVQKLVLARKNCTFVFAGSYSAPVKTKGQVVRLPFERNSGSDLLSRGVAPGVSSALKGLTAVFGMGTGVSPSLLPPERCPKIFDNCIGIEESVEKNKLSSPRLISTS